MTRVLVLYGTTDGHTRLIAEAIGDGLSMSGVDAEVVLAGSRDPDPLHYAAVIVAGSIHAGRYQRPVEHWVRKHAGELASMPTAFVSACLAVARKPGARTQADLDAVVQRFLKTTGWKPAVIKHVAGALLYRRYNFFKRWMMKRIVAQQGGETDTSKDYDYTDWADLRAFAAEFRRRIPAAA
jgi:menaquinone-dependent protoporphyrinogen oxidase